MAERPKGRPGRASKMSFFRPGFRFHNYIYMEILGRLGKKR